MLGNFILELPSIQSSILTLTHAHAGKVFVCSRFCSHRQYINIHDAFGVYDRLITAMQAVEMCE